MATTFKEEIGYQKRDKTANVKIRITHNRETTRVSTNIFVTPSDLTRETRKLKNQKIKDDINALISKWRNYINALGMATNSMKLREIVEYLKYKSNAELTPEQTEQNVFKLDFLEYGRKVAESKAEGTAKNYFSTIHALERFLNGRDLDVNDITSVFLKKFEEFIDKEPVYGYNRKTGATKSNKTKAGGRAVSSYLACLRHIYNEAQKEYNDDDIGVNNIPRYPFKKYKVKQPPVSKPRAVSRELLQQIINLPDFDRNDGSKVDFTLRDLARDLFILSFGLAGMNAADIFSVEAQDLKKNGNILIYKRKKTRTRRRDQAEMHIRIEPFLMPLVEKYLAKSGDYLFCFSKHYTSGNCFNTALTKGLHCIEEALQSEHFTFYSARHTWATVGNSYEAGIDKYTIHEGLNHKDEDMKTTDIYAARDYRKIWEANKKILSMFDWTQVEEREKIRAVNSLNVKKKAPKVHSITSNIVQDLINLPDFDNGKFNITGFARRDLARDIFLLSFGLTGITAPDLYNCPPQNLNAKENIIVYNRVNQVSRKNIEIKIRVEKCILPLIEKYRDQTGKRMFSFYRHYANAECFADAVNEGLERVVSALKCEKFTYYYVHKTWANIANFNKNAIYSSLKGRLTHRDLWEANRKTLSLFDWTDLTAREKQQNENLNYCQKLQIV